MPELPEVETVVRDLRPLLVGQTFTAVRVGQAKLRRPWKKPWAKALTGATVAAISRRGKWIVVELLVPSPWDGGGLGRVSFRAGSHPPPQPSPTRGEGAKPRLLVHLGMTGQFTVNAALDEVPDHTHVVFDLGNGTQLRFRDTRRFGSVELFPDAAVVEAFLDARLGPEPDAIDPDAFRTAIRSTSRTLKAILLDQTVVAGVGNIYADEALHRAGLHPERRGKTLTDAEIDRLRGFIAEVIAHAITFRGSTIRDYIGGSGLRGGFQNEFRAYGRDGQPCLTCATKLELVRVSGRASHFCPACQPAVTSPGRVSAAPSPRRRSRSG